MRVAQMRKKPTVLVVDLPRDSHGASPQFHSISFIFDKIVFDADLLRGSDDGRYVKFARSKGNIVLMPARRMLPSAL